MSDISLDDLDPAALAERLEAAITALTGTLPDPATLGDMPDHLRASMAGGVLTSCVLNILIAMNMKFAADDGDDGVHRAYVGALDQMVKGDRVLYAEALLALVHVWLMASPMADAVGEAQADSAAEHLRQAIAHMSGSKLPHPSPEEFLVADAVPSPAFTGPAEDAPPPQVAEIEQTRRVAEDFRAACAAIGVEVDDVLIGAPAGTVAHPSMMLSLLSGVMVGRAMLGYVNSTATLQGGSPLLSLVAPLWVRGFCLGATPDPEQPVSESILAGTAARMIKIVGMWHTELIDAPFADAIGHLCTAVFDASRANGRLDEGIDIADIAQHIAHHGADDDPRAGAIAAAEAALESLNNTPATM